MSTERRTLLRTISRPVIAGIVGAGLVVVLSGCTGSPVDASPAPTNTPTASATMAPEPVEPAPPALVPDGSAADNLPFFASIIDAVWASDAHGAGRAYVDALAAGGFEKQDMQVTKDLSTVGNAAESMQVSVRFAGECLVGQFGPATGEPESTVQSLLPADVCLLGVTRPIDW